MSESPGGGELPDGCFSFSAGLGATVAAIALGAILLVYVLNARLGFMPHYLSRIISTKHFMNEYHRRIDIITEHRVRDQYKIGDRLGAGVTATVYYITERSTQDCFAMKKIALKGKQSLQTAVEHEQKVLKKLKHRHITSLHDAFQTPKTVWVILEFVSGGELTHFITMSDAKWDETMAARCTFQVVQGLAYLHSQGICHRDIKLANLLRSNKSKDFEMKIADFGASCIFKVPEDCA